MASGSYNSLLSEPDPGSGLFRGDVIFRELNQLLTNGPVVMLLEIRRFKQINDGTGLLKRYEETAAQALASLD